MTLTQLRALVAVGRGGSILEAARLMHVTQPAISKSIAQAVDQMDEAAIKSMVRSLTTEIKAEFALMESEQTKD